ncbi:unnamed protein product [Toxocara canis]|uniref:MFSD8 n=1 Tax=Toxocara canis TaxID=6265 RepID=A0A183V4V8_TOXCA|nr:unnamed protein product [Toxocara canis]
MMADIKRSLLDVSPVSKGDEEEESCEEETPSSETFAEFCKSKPLIFLYIIFQLCLLSTLIITGSQSSQSFTFHALRETGD